MEGVGWLEEGNFAKQFCFKLKLVTEIIAGKKDSLGANLKERVIMMIVNLKKNINQKY